MLRPLTTLSEEHAHALLDEVHGRRHVLGRGAEGGSRAAGAAGSHRQALRSRSTTLRSRSTRPQSGGRLHRLGLYSGERTLSQSKYVVGSPAY